MVKRYCFILLCVLVLFSGTFSSIPNRASSGIEDPCSNYTHFLQPGTRSLIVCPAKDGPTLAQGNNQIVVVLRDFLGDPIPGILASDFWLIGVQDLRLCGGSGSIDADSDSDAEGQAIISGNIGAGGCTDELLVCVLGIIIGCPPTRLAICLRSPDLDGDLNVGLNDFSRFGQAYPSTVKPYDSCCDFDCDGDVDLVDFSIFGQHWLHRC
jgi:hypothetical protein